MSARSLSTQENQQECSDEALYHRARVMAGRRADELSRGDASSRPHTWIVSHGWFRMDLSAGTLVGAAVLLGAVCGVPPPQGQEEPTAEALSSPYTPDMHGLGSVTWDEFYNDFDMRSSNALLQPNAVTICRRRICLFARRD